jgi:hypothetical protein
MISEVLFEESYCMVAYDAEQEWVYVSWRGYQTIEQIKTGMEAQLKAIFSKKCRVSLSDLRQAKGTFTAANDWIEKDWLPRALSGGYRASAMLYSPDVFTKFAMNDLNQRYEKSKPSHFDMRYFFDEEPAIEWLKERK